MNADALPILVLMGHLAGCLTQKERSDDLRVMRLAYAEPKPENGP